MKGKASFATTNILKMRNILLRKLFVMGAVALGLTAFSPLAYATAPDISAGVELWYGGRELESPDVREGTSTVGTASLKLAAETMEGFSVFLTGGMADVEVEYIDSAERIEVIGEHGEVASFGFRWCAPVVEMGLPPIDGVRVGIGYEYLIIISSIDRIIEGGTSQPAPPNGEIEIQKHEFSLFISEWLDFLTLYVGGRFSGITDMEIEVPNEPTIDFTAKEEVGIIIGADIPLGELLADILPLPIDINLNFEVEALHELSLSLGGTITF